MNDDAAGCRVSRSREATGEERPGESAIESIGG